MSKMSYDRGAWALVWALLGVGQPAAADEAPARQTLMTLAQAQAANGGPAVQEQTVAGLLGRPHIEIGPASSRRYFPQAEEADAVGIRQAIEAGLAFSREVAMGRERLYQSQTQVEQSRGLLRPSLGTRVSVGRERSSPSSMTDSATGGPKAVDTHTRYDQSVVFKQPLFDRGTSADIDRRKLLQQGKDHDLQAMAATQYLAVVQAYTAAVSARLLAELAGEQEREFDHLLDYVGQRAAAGASSASDMERVRARSLTARASRLEQDGAQEAALVELTRLTNLAPRSIELPKLGDLGLTPPNSVADALRLALDHNRQLKSLEQDAEAGRHDVRVGSARFLPRFDFELSRGDVHNAGGVVGWQRDTRGVVAMSWQLYSGNTDVAYVRERVSRLQEAEFKVDDQRRRVTQEVGAAMANLDSVRARLGTGYRALSALTQALSSMRERMFAGNQSLLDLLDIIERHNQARGSLVTLHMQEIQAVAQVAQLTGGTPGVEGPAESESRRSTWSLLQF